MGYDVRITGDIDHGEGVLEIGSYAKIGWSAPLQAWVMAFIPEQVATDTP